MIVKQTTAVCAAADAQAASGILLRRRRGALGSRILEVRTEPSLLRNLPIEAITSKDVYDAAISGDKLAIDIFNYTGTILGELSPT